MSSFVSLQAPARTALSGDEPRTRLVNWWSLPLVVLLSVVLCVPFLRTILSMGDEGVLLHGAERMLRGERIYVDFFEFLPPGGFVLTELWLSLAGLSILAVRWLAIITIAGTACFTFLACRQVSRNAPFSAFLTLAWVMMSQGAWTDLSHHMITTMFSMAGVWAALVYAGEPDRRWLWAVVAGAVSGAASMVTPTCGALAMLAVLTVFFPPGRHRGALIAYVSAGLVVPASLLLYLVWRHAFIAAFDDVIMWTATRYAPIQALPYGHFAGGVNVPLLFVLPLSAVLAVAVGLRDWYAGARDRLLAPCVAFSLAGFVACYPRPDVFHIAYEIPLALPLLACCAIQLTERWRTGSRGVAFGAMAGLVTYNILTFLWIVQLLSGVARSPTPRGEAAFYRLDGAAQMLARIAALPAGDKFFFYPTIPMMTFLAGRQDVSRYDIFTPEYTSPAQYQEACESVMRHADWVVIDRRGMNPADLKVSFPAMQDLQPPETRAFEQALDSNFMFVARDGIYELRRRMDGTDDAVCAAVIK